MNRVGFTWILASVFALGLSACGGGDGNPGTSSSTTSASTSTSTTTATAAPMITLDLRSEADVSTSAISATGLNTLRATLKDSKGVALAGKVLTVSGDATQLKFPDGTSALTGADGVALLKVGRASLSSVGAGTMSVSYAYTDTGSTTASTATSTIGYQLSALNVSLSALDVGTTALAALGNRPITVLASINGVAATTSPVQVTFSASCGTVTPATVSTDSQGKANTTYAATLGCAGSSVSVSASAASATSVAGTISVSAPIATNVQFVSATPQTIYLKDSVGTTQSQVVFKVVDSGGNPIANKKLSLALSNTATGVGLDTVSNIAAKEFASDSSGLVTAAVFSGTVPTSLNVRATLVDTPTVFTDSNLLTVASGRPTQRSLSLSVDKLSIEAANRDGVEASITASMSDRQGNPVPPGTQVNFVSETGVMIPAACTVVAGQSGCSSILRSSGTRTASGRVSVLAYVSGEEDFVDKNANNIYDADEQHTDLGRAWRDDNGTVPTGADGIYSVGEFQVPRTGADPCNITECKGDGVWGAADVRRQATVVFASRAATISEDTLAVTTNFPSSNPATKVLNAIAITVADANNNSMPTGTTIVISAYNDGFSVPGLIGVSCTLASSSTVTVANTLLPITINNTLAGCTAGDGIRVTVTSPTNLVSERTFIFTP
jgi:hypothetical protein